MKRFTRYYIEITQGLDLGTAQIFTQQLEKRFPGLNVTIYEDSGSRTGVPGPVSGGNKADRDLIEAWALDLLSGLGG